MKGNLALKQQTRNKISATWRTHIFSDDTENFSTLSPAFSMSTGEYSIAFLLAAKVNRQYQLSVAVRKGLALEGRAIITLAVQSSTGSTRRVATYREENWTTDCVFNKFVTFDYVTDFVITCNITWLGFIDPYSPMIPRYIDVTPNFSFNQRCMSDLTLFVEDLEIPAHKVVLAANSPVFLAMFNTKEEESTDNRIVIEDTGHLTVETLCKIMYNNDTRDLDDIETALRVLAAAEKYQMTTIKSICEYKLQMKLNKDNALMVMTEADKCNAEELCCTVVEYIVAAEGEIMPLDELLTLCQEKKNISSAFIQTQLPKAFKDS